MQMRLCARFDHLPTFRTRIADRAVEVVAAGLAVVVGEFLAGEGDGDGLEAEGTQRPEDGEGGEGGGGEDAGGAVNGAKEGSDVHRNADGEDQQRAAGQVGDDARVGCGAAKRPGE